MADDITEEKCVEENMADLETILSQLNDENTVSDTLFMEKYQILVVEHFISCHDPLGELFQNSIVICHAKPRKLSERSCRSEIFSDDAGCPMALQFDKFYSDSSTRRRTNSLVKQLTQKYHLLPLSENIGQKILSMCKRIDSKSYHNLPVIAACHGENPKATVLIGYSKQSNSRFILEVQGLVTKQEELQRLDFLKEIHLQSFPASFATIDTHVYAHYAFLEYEGEEHSALNPVKDNSICMECTWSDTFALLEPLTAACTCFAKIKAVGGNTVTGAFSLYKEIQFIETLQKGLQTGMMSWSSSECDVMKRIKELINEQKTSLYKREIASVNSNLKNFDEAVLKNRKNLDFTEKLWIILKDCSSSEELQDAFSFVYNALTECFVPPHVFQKNMSTLAIDIKKMMEKSVVCPAMNPKLAIQLLLEIGMEKLRRDYVALFRRFIPLESISYFLEPDMLSLDAVICLKKLHSVLELTIVCIKRLSLSEILLSEFVRTTLKHYTTVPDIDLSHIFSFKIPAVKARQLLNPMRPTIWEISFVSSMNGFMKQSIHRYTTTPIHKHIYAPDNYHPKLMLKTASYVYSLAMLVQSDAFQD